MEFIGKLNFFGPGRNKDADVCVCVIPTSEGRPLSLKGLGGAVCPHSALRPCPVLRFC